MDIQDESIGKRKRVASAKLLEAAADADYEPVAKVARKSLKLNSGHAADDKDYADAGAAASSTAVSSSAGTKLRLKTTAKSEPAQQANVQEAPVQRGAAGPAPGATAATGVAGADAGAVPGYAAAAFQGMPSAAAAADGHAAAGDAGLGLGLGLGQAGFGAAQGLAAPSAASESVRLSGARPRVKGAPAGTGVAAGYNPTALSTGMAGVGGVGVAGMDAMQLQALQQMGMLGIPGAGLGLGADATGMQGLMTDPTAAWHAAASGGFGGAGAGVQWAHTSASEAVQSKNRRKGAAKSEIAQSLGANPDGHFWTRDDKYYSEMLARATAVVNQGLCHWNGPSDGRKKLLGVVPRGMNAKQQAAMQASGELSMGASLQNTYYEANIWLDTRSLTLGCFKTMAEAAVAFDYAQTYLRPTLKSQFGKSVAINFPTSASDCRVYPPIDPWPEPVAGGMAPHNEDGYAGSNPGADVGMGMGMGHMDMTGALGMGMGSSSIGMGMGIGSMGMGMGMGDHMGGMSGLAGMAGMGGGLGGYGSSLTAGMGSGMAGLAGMSGLAGVSGLVGAMSNTAGLGMGGGGVGLGQLLGSSAGLGMGMGLGLGGGLTGLGPGMSLAGATSAGLGRMVLNGVDMATLTSLGLAGPQSATAPHLQAPAPTAAATAASTAVLAQSMGLGNIGGAAAGLGLGAAAPAAPAAAVTAPAPAAAPQALTAASLGLNQSALASGMASLLGGAGASGSGPGSVLGGLDPSMLQGVLSALSSAGLQVSPEILASLLQGGAAGQAVDLGTQAQAEGHAATGAGTGVAAAEPAAGAGQAQPVQPLAAPAATTAPQHTADVEAARPLSEDEMGILADEMKSLEASNPDVHRDLLSAVQSLYVHSEGAGGAVVEGSETAIYRDVLKRHAEAGHRAAQLIQRMAQVQG